MRNEGGKDKGSSEGGYNREYGMKEELKTEGG